MLHKRGAGLADVHGAAQGRPSPERSLASLPYARARGGGGGGVPSGPKQPPSGVSKWGS